MADTRQVVHWALEHECRLRSGDAISAIDSAIDAVRAAGRYAEGLKAVGDRNNIIGDLHITGMTHATLPSRMSVPTTEGDRITGRSAQKKYYYYPYSGYFISERFKHLGGPAELLAMCGNCPANVGKPLPAGCVGGIYRPPYNQEAEEELQGIIDRLGLRGALAEHFIETTPIWFGLWVNSPLAPASAKILVELVTALAVDDGDEDTRARSWREDIQRLLAATSFAARGERKLHVRMSPPGHTDFGVYTIFPHCPRCKAEAGLARWQPAYPTELYRCTVCGERYSPAEQQSREPDKGNLDTPLRELLGPERFRELARAFLTANGISESEADETVRLSEATELKNQAIRDQKRREHEARKRYLNGTLYADLNRATLPSNDDDEGDGAEGFHAPDFLKLIHRCAEQGIAITGMVHSSTDDAMSRAALPFLKNRNATFDPLATFQQWRSEGCDELFEAYFKIPQSLIDALGAQSP